MKTLTIRAYESIYENGADLTELDFPAINLDNGRLLELQRPNSTSAEINANIPHYWSS